MADARSMMQVNAGIWRWAVLGAAVLIVTLGLRLGLPMALLCVAGTVLVGAVFLLWSSMQSLTGETPLTLEEAVGLGAPSAEEERKRAVLRALKDLEFEHSVGKISDADFRELSARYRQEAKQLLRTLDEGLSPLKQRLEAELAEQILAAADGAVPRKKRKKRKKESAPRSSATEGKTPSNDSADKEAADQASGAVDEGTGAAGAAPDDRRSANDTADTEEATGEARGGNECRSCGVRNDSDARFCKGCGGSMTAEEG